MRVEFSIFLPDREVKRIDLVLSTIFKDHSRSSLQKVIERGLVQVNGKTLDRQCKVRSRDTVSIEFVAEKSTIEAEALPIEILYENELFAIISKDPFMNVHPVSGENGRTGTLVNALLHHLWSLSVIGGVERPGLVHRLDKDTSGLLIIAKNDRTMRALQKKMYDRKIKKRYLAFVRGEINEPDGCIESFIGRDQNDRKRMTTKNPVAPKLAQTKFRTLECVNGNSLLLVELLTGRTHQIRVHVADIGFPIVGDATYGNPKTNREYLEKTGLKRQWLHAYHLEFELFGTCYSFKAPLKADLKASIENAVLERNGIVSEAEVQTWKYREDIV